MRRFSVLFVLLCLMNNVNAHKLVPSLLELRELPGGLIGLWWKTPVLAAKVPTVVLPESCQVIDRQDQAVSEGAIEQRYSLLCHKSTASLEFAIEGLTASRSAALLRWYGIGGDEQQALLSSDEDRFSPAMQGSGGSAIFQFTSLGFKHILIGLDHLLFVLGLLLIASNRYQLLAWISAFTVGHSITLFLVSIGLIPHWPNLTEWLIAASVLVMALYAGKSVAASDTKLGGKWFIVLVGAFGLLHGLGFASVLDELTVSSADILPALLGFNIGIELGQIFFIAMVAALLLAVRRTVATMPLRRVALLSGAQTATIYVMGSVAVFWMIDRGLSLFEATFRSIY
jgi:hypothetical protein